MTPLNDLASQINQNARDKGFWESERNLGEMLMLAVSELSEALEEHRAGRPAVYVPAHRQGCPGSGDGLPDGRTAEVKSYPCDGLCKTEGMAVELADCIIRCLDTIHSLGGDADQRITQVLAEEPRHLQLLGSNFGDSLSFITYWTVMARDELLTDYWLARTITGCWELMERLGVEPIDVITQKVAYNATRQYKHGKAY